MLLCRLGLIEGVFVCLSFLLEGGREILLGKIRALENKIKLVASQKGDAYENGGNGWHDNFAFEQLAREETMLINELMNLKDVLRSAVVVSSFSTSIDRVDIGCIVALRDDEGNEVEYCVVGYGESDISTTPKRLEYLAPIIHPFMEGVVGDEHTLQIGSKQVVLTLAGIRRG
jgi:transcription elongation GreA/GreB family factor